MDTGCGTVDSWSLPRYQLTRIIYLLLTVCRKNKQRKRGDEWPIFKKKKLFVLSLNICHVGQTSWRRRHFLHRCEMVLAPFVHAWVDTIIRLRTSSCCCRCCCYYLYLCPAKSQKVLTKFMI